MSTARSILLKLTVITFIACSFTLSQETSQITQKANQNKTVFPVVLDNDTLFNIYSGIGPFSAQKRATEVSKVLEELLREDEINIDSIKASTKNGMALLKYKSITIMAITLEDSAANGKSIANLSDEYLNIKYN